MFLRRIFVIISIFFLVTSPANAHKLSLKAKVKKFFTPNTVKSKPLQVKTIPYGSSCTPDIPDNCNVKK